MNHRPRLLGALALTALLTGAPLGLRAQEPAQFAPIPPPPPPPPDIPENPDPTAPMAPAEAPIAPPPTLPTAPDAPTQPTLPPDTGVTSRRPLTLRYKFTPGQTLRYRMTVDTDGTVQVGATGTTTPLKQHIDMTLRETVKSVRPTDGAATLTVQIDSFAMTNNGKLLTLPEKARQSFQEPTTVVMTPAGKPLSVQSALSSSPVSGMGLSPADLQNVRHLPEKPVSVGDTWRSSVEAADAGINTFAAYTLNSLSSDGATATIGQKLYTEVKPAKVSPTGHPAPRINGLITGTGTEQFDVNAGEVAAQSADLQVKLTVNPPATPHSSTPTVKTQMHVVTKMERLGDTNTSVTTPAPNPPPPAPGPPQTPKPSDEPPTGQLQ